MNLFKWLILLLVSVIQADALSLCPSFICRKKPSWAYNYLIKHGVRETVAVSALLGLTDEQLLAIPHGELIILARLLKTLDTTIHDTQVLATHLIPGLNDTQVDKWTSVTASSLRRSIDVIFDLLTGRPSKVPWSQLGTNAQKLVTTTLCDGLLREVPFCRGDSPKTSTTKTSKKSEL